MQSRNPGQGRFVLFSFSRNWLFGVAFHGSIRHGSVRRDDRFVSFRFASFPFHRRFLTSVSLLDEEFTLCWRACGSGGLERIVG